MEQTEEEKERNTRVIAKYLAVKTLENLEIDNEIFIEEFFVLIAKYYADRKSDEDFLHILKLLNNTHEDYQKKENPTESLKDVKDVLKGMSDLVDSMKKLR